MSWGWGGQGEGTAGSMKTNLPLLTSQGGCKASVDTKVAGPLQTWLVLFTGSLKSSGRGWGLRGAGERTPAKGQPHLVSGDSWVPRGTLSRGFISETSPRGIPWQSPLHASYCSEKNPRALNAELAGSPQSQRERQGGPHLSVLKCSEKAMFPIIRFCWAGAGERGRKAWTQLMLWK